MIVMDFLPFAPPLAATRTERAGRRRDDNRSAAAKSKRRAAARRDRYARHGKNRCCRDGYERGLINAATS
jgi:hypothetical protein